MVAAPEVEGPEGVKEAEIVEDIVNSCSEYGKKDNTIGRNVGAVRGRLTCQVTR